MLKAKLERVDVGWMLTARVCGRRIQRTIREKSKAAAEVIARQIIATAERDAAGLPPMPTVRELTKEWLATFEHTHSAAHYKNVDVFYRLHLGKLAAVCLDEVTTAMVEHARDSFIAEADRASSTANAWLKNLKLLFRWAVTRGVLPSVPWAVKPLKAQKPVKTVLFAAQMLPWMNAVDQQGNDHLSLGARMMLQLGLRESEVLSGRWEWFDFTTNTYTPGKTKGFEAEPISLVPSLREYVYPRRRVSGLLVSRIDGSPQQSGCFGEGFKAANAKIGVHGITPHSLRRSFATQFHNQGCTLEQIGKLLRHKSIAVTQLYIVATPRNMGDEFIRFEQEFALWHTEKLANEREKSAAISP